jgi:hypothetical protein
MSTYYETRAVRTDEGGTGVEVERYTTLEAAIVGSLELWPEDDHSDVLIYVTTDGNTDLAATIRHHHHDEPSVATVCVFTTTGRPDVVVNEFHCGYVELYGRIHTNISRVQDR